METEDLLKNTFEKKNKIVIDKEIDYKEKKLDERVAELEIKMYKLWEMLISDKNPKKEPRLTTFGKKFRGRI